MTNELQGIPQNIIDRIKKLMDLQEGAAAIGSLAESENAAKRISELLMKYNLEMSDIEDFKLSEKNPVIEDLIDMDEHMNRHEAGWVTDLMNTLAKFNMCQVVTYRGGGKGKYGVDPAALIGRKHNVEIVKYLTIQLAGKIRTSCKNAYKIYMGDEKPNTFKRGYFRGAVSGIFHQLHLQRMELLKADEVNVGEGKMWGLIKKNDEAVGEFINKKFGKLGSGGPAKKLKSDDGRRQGFKDGTNMQINTGLNTNTPKAHIN